MESVFRKAMVHRNSILLSKNVQLLVYADDIDVIDHTKGDVTAACSAFNCESIDMGLASNEGNTLFTSNDFNINSSFNL